jgi:hypothetical protein
MPYYKHLNLLFIHIPKTAGTAIENEISSKYEQSLYTGFTNDLLEYPHNNKSLQHQFYTTIYEFRSKLDVDFNNIKIFTVVRNPYDRIISDLFWWGLINKETSDDEVYNVIKNNYLNRDDLDNHNEPQYKFITDKDLNLISNIKIFKCELLNEINDELNKFLEFDINIINNDANKNYSKYSKYLNKESISLINEKYKTDFELFNYTLIDV